MIQDRIESLRKGFHTVDHQQQFMIKIHQAPSFGSRPRIKVFTLLLGAIDIGWNQRSNHIKTHQIMAKCTGIRTERRALGQAFIG